MCHDVIDDLLVVPSDGNIILLLLVKELHNGKHHCHIDAVIWDTLIVGMTHDCFVACVSHHHHKIMWHLFRGLRIAEHQMHTALVAKPVARKACSHFWVRSDWFWVVCFGAEESRRDYYILTYNIFVVNIALQKEFMDLWRR